MPDLHLITHNKKTSLPYQKNPPHAPPPFNLQFSIPTFPRGPALPPHALHLALGGSDGGQVPRSESVRVLLQ